MWFRITLVANQVHESALFPPNVAHGLVGDGPRFGKQRSAPSGVAQEKHAAVDAVGTKPNNKVVVRIEEKLLKP